ncbi:sugar nucleotide-binding protein [Gammaproteobacteria bacterium]|nr:sugar nucleotide-binding protein [Gammaproteobacteria bacterium]
MLYQENILILGAYGFLGSRLSHFLKEKGYKVFRHGRGVEADFKISDYNNLHKKITTNNISSIVNLVAATDVDECEKNIDLAFGSNISFTQSIVNEVLKIKENHKPHFIQISTDQVYQGIGPHIESSARPLNIYALSKFSSELIASKIQSTILRTNFVGRNSDNKKDSLSDFIIKSLRSEKKISVFSDVYFNPLFIDTLCEIIELSIKAKTNGLYNVGSSTGISKSQFAFYIAKKLDLKKNLMKEVSINTFKDLVARRPLDMRMDCSAFSNEFDYQLPSIDNEMTKLVEEYR